MSTYTKATVDRGREVYWRQRLLGDSEEDALRKALEAVSEMVQADMY